MGVLCLYMSMWINVGLDSVQFMQLLPVSLSLQALIWHFTAVYMLTCEFYRL